MKNRLFIKVLSALCLSVALLFATTTTVAQTPPSGVQQLSLYVTVGTKQVTTTAGPYARYAQKYLGVAAPLTDKVLNEVVFAKINDVSNLQVEHEAVESGRISHMNPPDGFPRLTVDKSSAAALSLEESARMAAEKIFEIRRSRFDLITGEVGENVFGGGLEAALSELSRLEEEYLSLFLGKQSVRTDLKQYRVTPAKGRSTYIVCRFSESGGLLPTDDLSGEPVVLELRPTDEDAASQSAVNQGKPNSRAVATLVPAQMRCRVILDGVELASEEFSIPQLGETVYL
jgi:hypothetical protein